MQYLSAVLMTSILMAVTAHRNHEADNIRGNTGYLTNAYDNDPIFISGNPSSAPSTWVRFRSNAANYYWDGGKPNLGLLTPSSRKSAPRSQSQNSGNWNPKPYVNSYRGENFGDDDDASVSGVGLYNIGRSWAIYNMNWDNFNVGSYRKENGSPNDWVDQGNDNGYQWSSSDW